MESRRAVDVAAVLSPTQRAVLLAAAKLCPTTWYALIESLPNKGRGVGHRTVRSLMDRGMMIETETRRDDRGISTNVGERDITDFGREVASLIQQQCPAMIAICGLAFVGHVVLSRIRPTPTVAATDNEGGEQS